jgi:superfamily II DNA or RNA helicase
MILRDYQHKMLDDTRAALRLHRSVVIQSECGSGKGSVCAYMINRAVERGRHVLFLVRSRDRVSDMSQRVTKLGIEHGVLMGGSRREHWHPVQVASIDTLWRMEHKPKASLLLLDESHYSLARTFREVLSFYGDGTKVIGMTATPALGNNRGLGVKSGGIFESMVHGPTVTELIAQGHLVGSRLFAPPAPPEMKGLKKKRTGEFDNEQGAAICDNAKVIGDVVEHWERYGKDRKAIIFGFNQKHAFDIAESFRKKDHNFAYVDCETPDGDIHTPGTRKFMWHQMEFGDLVGLVSVNVLSCGFDMPPAKYIGLAAKTASFPLYRQRLGRGSRPYRDFTHFVISDHCNGYAEFISQGAFFESEIDWQLDGDDAIKPKDKDNAPRVAMCKTPMKAPDTGVPFHFKGPVSPDGRWLLPCYRCFSPGPTQCPYCGLPLETGAREIEHEAGELQEVEFIPKTEKQSEAERKKKDKYFELVQLAHEKGYKPGYPFVVFKSVFGHPPPRAWKQEAFAAAERRLARDNAEHEALYI